MKKFNPLKEKINALEPWYSVGDISHLFGKSRQYWTKLIIQKKIHAQKTSAGWITTHTWFSKSGYMPKKK